MIFNKGFDKKSIEHKLFFTYFTTLSTYTTFSPNTIFTRFMRKFLNLHIFLFEISINFHIILLNAESSL